MDELSIREILELVPRGQIRVPAFQRGFVWDPDMVAFLMDSIYKGYPIGSLLLWRTREQMRHERQLGPFELPDRDPEYPIDYVLDGQQRITSIYGVFQSEIEPDLSVDWSEIFFDLSADPDAQESQFLALEPDEVEAERHFALKHVFDPVDYRRATGEFGDNDVITLDEMQSRIKEARIPVQLLTTEDRAKVAIVFERVNRTGVPLDTLQLLTAWTWSEEFDLQYQFEELREELEPFGFAGVGEDSNLLLRCCAAVLAHDASPQALVGLNGADVRERFEEIVNGVKGAIDFVKSNFLAETLENLPFSTILVPLSVFFAIPENQQVKFDDVTRARLVRWFWRACFSRRYSSGVLRNLKEDIEAMNALKNGEDSSLGDFAVVLSADFFSSGVFRINSVNTKTFILFLAQFEPLSFASANPVGLSRVLRDYNRSEFHHLYPRAYLQAQGVETKEQNRLANFCFLSKADNMHLGGTAPSEYRAKMPEEVEQILEHAICPANLFNDDYDPFIAERSIILLDRAQALLDYEG